MGKRSWGADQMKQPKDYDETPDWWQDPPRKAHPVFAYAALILAGWLMMVGLVTVFGWVVEAL
jgi:hypothetical protein